MEEFFDIGKALAMQPPATGRNIGILTDAGGPGVMTVDEFETLGLTADHFCPETDAEIRGTQKTRFNPANCSHHTTQLT